MGKSSRAYAELAGRTESTVTDVSLALIDMGMLSLCAFYHVTL
jgi:hypothetical protein